MSFQLKEWPLPYIRVACEKCSREGKLNIDRLISQYGGEINMFELRMKITDPGCTRSDRSFPCMSTLPDAFLVDAILADDEDNAFKKELLPEARRWRDEMGLRPAKALSRPDVGMNSNDESK